MKRLTYVFGCPVCRKIFKYDEPGEPCCTGPSEMRDDHPMIVMRLVRIQKTEVNPRFAKRRSEGRLLLPHMEEEILREAKILIT